MEDTTGKEKRESEKRIGADWEKLRKNNRPGRKLRCCAPLSSYSKNQAR
ncbi:hypothetical protein [uncultured Alistipes sp.]|nr:hypothetical protein [uncultured Alistipes sp.]